MSSKTETSNAQVIANLTTVIDTVNSFGPVYQPSNPVIQINELRNLRTNVLFINEKYEECKTALNTYIDKQQIEFKDLPTLTTQVTSAFQSSGASAQSIETLQTVTRKIKGERAQKLKPLTDGSKLTDTSISVSQLSYANRISNFSNMILTLKTEPKYNPNEAHLTISTLLDKLDKMKNAVNQTSLLQPEFNALRIRRNVALYHPETGVVNITKLIKSYTKSLFGTKSPQYKQLTAIIFKSKKIS